VAVLVTTGVFFFVLRHRLGGFHYQVVPLFAAIAVFYVVVVAYGLDLANLRDLNWVFKQPRSEPFQAVWTVDFRLVSWPALRDNLLTATMMCVTALLASYSSLGACFANFVEDAAPEDPDNTATIFGYQMLAGACVVAVPSGVGVGPSRLLHSAVGVGKNTWFAILVCGMCCLVIFFTAFPLISYIPKFAVGAGVLFPTGCGMLETFLSYKRQTDAKSYAVVVLFALIMYHESLNTGLLLAFAYNTFRVTMNYSELPFGTEATLKSVRSLKDRVDDDFIFSHGDACVTKRLQGILFSGNVARLKVELENALRKEVPPKFICLDMSNLAYIGKNVWHVLRTLERRLKKAHSVVFFCGLPEEYQAQAAEQRFLESECFQYVRSLALGIEICEDHISSFSPAIGTQASLLDFSAWLQHLSESLGKQADLLVDAEKVLPGILTDVTFDSGEMVYRQQIDEESMAWVLSGEFHVFVSKEDGVAVLGRKLVAGNAFGGVCGSEASATTQCKTRGTLRCLSRTALRGLSLSHPRLLAGLLLAYAQHRDAFIQSVLTYGYQPDLIALESQEKFSRKASFGRVFTQAPSFGGSRTASMAA
jgi:MFS superfamily sulfate permease-like transporter